MSLADLEALLKAEQQQIDNLERQLTGLLDGVLAMTAEECHRFSDGVARTKQFFETIETRAS